jgi:hypothetical protein
MLILQEHRPRSYCNKILLDYMIILLGIQDMPYV